METIDAQHEVGRVVAAAAADSLKVMGAMSSPQTILFLKEASVLLAETFRAGGKVLIAGNGGSLCDAAHFAEELTGRFRINRPALPAIVLAEPGHITCVGNDFGFDEIYRRGIEAFGRPGDVFFALTTSGRSPNIIAAVREAKSRGMKVVCLIGKGGGDLLNVGDLQLVVPEATTTDRIQEVHMACLHIVIEGVEALLFGL